MKDIFCIAKLSRNFHSYRSKMLDQLAVFLCLFSTTQSPTRFANVAKLGSELKSRSVSRNFSSISHSTVTKETHKSPISRTIVHPRFGWQIFSFESDVLSSAFQKCVLKSSLYHGQTREHKTLLEHVPDLAECCFLLIEVASILVGKGKWMYYSSHKDIALTTFSIVEIKSNVSLRTEKKCAVLSWTESSSNV